MSDFNGWKNWETWNVALWIQNDEGIYRKAKRFTNYRDFAHHITYDENWYETPDGAPWEDENLDHDALDEMIREL